MCGLSRQVVSHGIGLSRQFSLYLTRKTSLYSCNGPMDGLNCEVSVYIDIHVLVLHAYS